MSSQDAPATPAFTLNGTSIPLAPQAREHFAWLASQVYRQIHRGSNGPVPLPALLTMVAHEGTTAQGIGTDDPRIQAILLTLHQLGIGTASVQGEGADRQAKWEKGSHKGIDGQPILDCFSEAGIADGRALAAALAIAGARRININGTDIPVRINDVELMKAQVAEVQKRRQDESHHASMAAARYIAELVTEGAGPNDLRLRAALEIAADLGLRALAVDTVNRSLRIAAFSREAAMAAAFLQGAPVEQLPGILAQVDAMQKSAEETAKRLAAQQGGSAGGAATAPGSAGKERPGTAGGSVVRRRRR